MTGDFEMFNKILVPLDGSELAEAVLPQVGSIARCTGASVILLRVLVEPSFEYAYPDPMLLEQVHQQVREDAQEYLDRMALQLKEQGFVVTVEMGRGPVAETILKCAEGMQADLIAMSTHGRSGMARWLLGSVADRVVHASPIPVLLVRPGPGKA
jgi:nucleotide-binding universal stress UspA family protein